MTALSGPKSGDLIRDHDRQPRTPTSLYRAHARTRAIDPDPLDSIRAMGPGSGGVSAGPFSAGTWQMPRPSHGEPPMHAVPWQPSLAVADGTCRLSASR